MTSFVSLYLLQLAIFMSLSVTKVTGWMAGVWFQAGTRIFLCSCVQTSSGAYPASCIIHMVIKQPDCEGDHCFNLHTLTSSWCAS